MKQTYAVLLSSSDTRNVRKFDGAPPFGGPVAEVQAESGSLTVRFEELDDRQRQVLLADRRVEVAAPAMPMTLIAPVSRIQGLAANAAAHGDSWGIAAVRADQAGGLTGQGVVVAVLDTGIDRQHPAFAGIQLVGRNFTAGEPDAFDDDDGHGTHCAGTIFGRDVQGRRIGIARGISKAVIGRVIGAGGGSSAQIAEAVQWAVSEGAQVISMSLGIDFPTYIAQLQANNIPARQAYSMGLSAYRENIRLFDRLASLVAVSGNPTLLVAAAGNESQRTGNPPYELEVAPPAIADGFISVAALENGPAGLRAASFSNSGAEVAAPGVDILSAAPGGGLALMSGTSMATPHVAGIAALWAEKLVAIRQMSARNFRTRVSSSATFNGIDPNTEPGEVGGGIVSAPTV